MSYQSIHINNLSFIKKHYLDQIKALDLFYQESKMKSIPTQKIKFGGGTALSMYYFQHRLSFDIDLLVEDIQYLDFIRPKLWIDESNSFNPNEYIEQQNHIGLTTSNDITEGFIDNTHKIFPFDLYIESIENILAKKITFRKKDNKARDIFDIATALSKDKNIIKQMLQQNKIIKDDLLILKDSLNNLNLNKFAIAIEMVEPFQEYKNIALNAHKIILENLEKISF